MKVPRPTATSSPAADPVRLTKGGAQTADERAAAALLSRLPRASVSGPALERVWRAVTSSPARPTRRLARVIPYAGLAAAFAVLIGVLWGSSRPARSRVELTFSSGGVFAATQAKDWHPSRTGEALAETDRLRTDDAGRALVRIRGVAALLVGEKSDVGLERLARGTTLRLAGGTLTARVSKRAPDEPFVVEAGRYTVKVVGTLFTVEEGPGDHTAVSVREGVVEVSDQHGRVVARVIAGARWTSDAPETRAPDRTPDGVAKLLEEGLTADGEGDLAREFGALAKAAPAAKTPDAPGQVEPRAASNPPPGEHAPPSAPLGDARREHALRDDVLPERAEASNRTAAPPRVSPSAPAASASTSASAAPPPAPPPPSPEALAAPEPPPPPATALSLGADAGVDPYAQAMELEARGDVDGAARELAKAAEFDPLRGDLALYSLGRLEHRRLHDPASALATFRRYRERYPRGALLPEVDFEILQLDLETHDRSAALAETARFLASHPTSERAPQVHLLRGNLLRDGRKCEGALPEYAAVHEASLADDALYSTAYCQRKLGDRAAAASTLAEYLRRFPRGDHRADAVRALESGREIESGTEK